jgi:hypothetical protein
MGTYADQHLQGMIEERRRAFRKYLPLFLLVAAGAAVVVAAAFYLLFRDRMVPAWTLGPVALLAMFWALKSQLAGTYHLESGLEAQSWTSTDLKRALGRGWYVIDNISFGGMGNVDHVVIGPGGVLAVETKYTDSSLESRRGRETVAEWVAQSHEMARHLRLMLRSNYGHMVQPTPIVITSGTELLKLPADLEGSAVVRRRHVKQLVRSWQEATAVLGRQEIENLRAALVDFKGKREAADRKLS